MKTETLENSAEYFKDDTILICCDITIMNAPTVGPKDLETLHLLCDCKDDLCKNLHAINKDTATAQRKLSASNVLKSLFLGCGLPI